MFRQDQSCLDASMLSLAAVRKRIPPDWGPQWLTEKIKDGTTHRFEIYFEHDQYDTMDGNNDYDEDAGWKLDGYATRASNWVLLWFEPFSNCCLERHHAGWILQLCLSRFDKELGCARVFTVVVGLSLFCLFNGHNLTHGE